MVGMFEYGEVECTCSDHLTRQIAIKVSAPWCVVQTAMAIMLGHGFVDALCLKQPLVAWVPQIPLDRFQASAIAEVPNMPERVSAVVQDRVSSSLQLFADLAQVLKNPDDAIGFLPMGVYVVFQFRSTYEGLAEIVQKLEPMGTPGVLEFRYAVASVLAEVLIDAGSIDSIEFDANNIPFLLGPAALDNFSDLAASAIPAQGHDSFRKDG